MNVAIVYDRVNKWGGAERVLLALHEMFPGAPLYTSLYSPQKAKWARKFEVRTSFLQRLKFLRDKHELLGLFMPIAFESFDFSEFDLVISVTSESAKGIITPPQVKHICICLTPTRYLWSEYGQYFKNPIFRFITSPLVWYLKKWELVAIQRPDYIIAISQNIQRKIGKFYGKKSDVIYPPASSILQEENIIEPQNKDYLLVVSRLVPYKKIDIVVKAANELNLPLVVVGKGIEEQYLREIAGKTVQFKRSVRDDVLRGYLKNAKVLIYPSEEDFGIGMVEAQLHGTPVIAFRKGAASEIVVPGETGELFEQQTAGSLIAVLKKFNATSYNRDRCRKNGMRFSNQVFKSALTRYIRKVI